MGKEGEAKFGDDNTMLSRLRIDIDHIGALG
jgi:hypothetical protein